MLTCKEFDDFMIDYLEGNLSIWQKYMCWMHVKFCRECAYYIQQYQKVIQLEQKAFDSPGDPVPDTVPEELIKAAMAHYKKA